MIGEGDGVDVRCRREKCNMMRCEVEHETAPCDRRQYYTTMYRNTLHHIALHCTTLHYTTLRYTTLHYTTLHYTTLHHIALHSTPHHTIPYDTTAHDTTPHRTIARSNTATFVLVLESLWGPPYRAGRLQLSPHQCFQWAHLQGLEPLFSSDS